MLSLRFSPAAAPAKLADADPPLPPPSSFPACVPALLCCAECHPELRLSPGLAEPDQEAFQGAGKGDHRGQAGAGEHGRGKKPSRLPQATCRVPRLPLLLLASSSPHVLHVISRPTPMPTKIRAVPFQRKLGKQRCWLPWFLWVFSKELFVDVGTCSGLWSSGGVGSRTEKAEIIPGIFHARGVGSPRGCPCVVLPSFVPR